MTEAEEAYERARMRELGICYGCGKLAIPGMTPLVDDLCKRCWIKKYEAEPPTEEGGK